MHEPVLHVARCLRHSAGPCTRLMFAILLLVLPATFVSAVEVMNPADENVAGKNIFQKQCAACHGEKGEGVADEYPSPLIGDKPFADLRKSIHETMPADAPGELSAEDAENVSRYVYDAFYSPIAQARNSPARIQLSRLTVRQYENAVTDLLASFRKRDSLNGPRGLQARKSKTRQWPNIKDPPVDGKIDFDFGEESPVEDDDAPEDFSIRWDGSVITKETGDYEFIVETENGVRLHINNNKTPLIDAGVKSGDDTVFRQTIRLLGGRAYPLHLYFVKSKPEKTASIKLKWRPPHQSEEVIPERNLMPLKVTESFVLSTKFPPDDRSTGFERGTSISKAWFESATHSSLEVATHVVDNVYQWIGVKADAEDAEKRLKDFCVKFTERAFRRPLTDEDRQIYIDRQFEERDFDTAIKRVVVLVLTSPRFLYREAGRGEMDQYDMASWLSFTLWDSLPDDDLFRAARENKLQSRDQIERQAQRMLSDARARAKMREFLHQWLKLDHFHEVEKNVTLFPEFTDEIESDLRTSLDLFLEDVVWGESPDFRRLLLAEEIYMNGRLAKFYGVDLPEDAEFQLVRLDDGERAGVLTHPFLMSAFAYDSTTSPIHRGVFIARSVLGRILMPPPIAVSPLSPSLHADLTTRERVHLQTSPGACVKCHTMINPLGFSLEQFDAVGRFRTEELGKPIDTTGEYVSRTGEKVTFKGIRDLAQYLSESHECPESFAEQLFQYSVKQPAQAFGAEEIQNLGHTFKNFDYNVQRLMVDIATRSALRARELHAGQSNVAKQ